jgi:hypothetical protein
MSDEAKRRTRIGAIIIPMLLALYVLGAGPACRWGNLGNPVTARWTQIAYRPVFVLARHKVPGTILANYINLWSPQRSVVRVDGFGLGFRGPCPDE